MKNTVLFILYVFLGFPLSAAGIFEGPPVLNFARIYGQHPATPFLFYLACAGERPLNYSIKSLPAGLTLEPQTGIISGMAPTEGEWNLEVQVENARGKAVGNLKLVIGEKTCLTPPLGWNSWNVFTGSINEQMLIEMADAMVSSGMRDAGYTYLNIDDFWHADQRDSSGKPVADPVLFPRGIRYISDYLHKRGLKLGIYSDAGIKTCGGEFGSYGFEARDAKTYSDWGRDLLKYDFCHVPWKKKEALLRYARMGEELRKSGRTIVYSICNWGLFAPWKWAASCGGAYWRTTPDIFDTWSGGNPFMMSTLRILKRQRALDKYAGPGHWNDPDMLIVGNEGKGKATSRGGKFKGMTATQYESHFALWAMMNAPLLASHDLRTQKPSELALLTHRALLDLHQDVLGKAAAYQGSRNGVWIYRKETSQGDAWIYFNPTSSPRKISLKEVLPAGSGNLMEVISQQSIDFRSGSGLMLEAYQTKILIKM